MYYFKVLFVDFNECKEKNNMNCDHFCVNVKEGYKCACRDGYLLDPDEKTCIGELTLSKHLLKSSNNVKDLSLNMHVLGLHSQT